MRYIFTHYTTYNQEHHPGINVLLSSIKALNDDKIKVILFYEGYNYKHFDQYKKFIDIIDINNIGWLPEMRSNVQRYFLYRNYIEKNIFKFKNTDTFLHCDSVDVVFQKNIFNKLTPALEDKIIFFTEEEEFTLGSGTLNTKWLKHLHNTTESPYVQNILHNNIICSGTILFTNLIVFIKFLNSYCSYQLVNMCTNNKFRETPYNKTGYCNDQGVVNSLVYNFPEPQYTFIKNKELHLICTMDLMSQYKEKYKMTIRSDMLYINKVAPCILHQYNRFSTVKDFFYTLYNDEDFELEA